MGKKNKKKNKKSEETQTTIESSTSDIATITVIVDSEAEKEKLEEDIKEIDEYLLKKQEEADQYYAEKKEEADELRAHAQAEIDRRAEAAIAQRLKEKKKEIEKLEKKGQEIIKRANEEAESQAKQIEEQRVELDKRQEEHLQAVAALEATKVSYKNEMLKRIEKEIQAISSEKIELEKIIEDLRKQLEKEQREKTHLHEDLDFFQKEIEENQIRRSELDSYKLRIDRLQADYAILNNFYKQQTEKLEELKTQILMYGDDPSKAVRENIELQKRIEELQSLVSSCPSAKELQILRETSTEYLRIQEELTAYKEKCSKLESENRELIVDKDEIESYRRFIKILELQKSELQRELDRNIQLYSGRTEKIFANLSILDSKSEDQYESIIQYWDLKKLCIAFRGYLANREKNPLYYDERTIRTFIAGFASSRLMILEGLSGTGKSSLPKAFADFLGAHTIPVAVQSSWKDRNDLLGFYNDFKKQYKETDFLKALYRATSDPNNIYIIVLDEMNLSRIEYYFADFLSVLQETDVEKWKIDLIPDYASITQNKDAWPKLINEGKIQICDNTWFIGTANKDDSTFIITDKVYDRATVISFDKKGEKERIDSAEQIKMNNEDFQTLLKRAERFPNEASKTRFNEMITRLDYQVRELFQITFGNRIAIQLEKFVPVYLACGGTVDEAVDVMFSRKILRKLEGIYDDNTKMSLELLKEDIEKQKYNLPLTLEAIKRMIDKM